MTALEADVMSRRPWIMAIVLGVTACGGASSAAPAAAPTTTTTTTTTTTLVRTVGASVAGLGFEVHQEPG